jgi:hypothetical protein
MRAASHRCFRPAKLAGNLIWSTARRRHRHQSLMFSIVQRLNNG